jgi:hypothetical protein
MDLYGQTVEIYDCRTRRVQVVGLQWRREYVCARRLWSNQGGEGEDSGEVHLYTIDGGDYGRTQGWSCMVLLGGTSVWSTFSHQRLEMCGGASRGVQMAVSE